MLTLGLLFTVLSSLGWAGFDVVRKHMVRRLDPGALVVLVNLVQVPGFVVWLLVEGPRIEAGYLKFFWGSLLLNLAAHLLFFRSVRLSPLSSTIPLLGLTPVFTALVGMSWAGEYVTERQWVGISAVVVGALILNATRKDIERPWRLVTSIARERGSLYMAAVALLWSIAPFFDKRALTHASVGVHGALLSAGIATAMWLWLLASRRSHSLRAAGEVKGSLLISALTALLAFGCQLLAIQIMLVSLFEGLKRGSGMILSVLSGRVFFDEQIRPTKMISVLAMTAGVLLLI